MCKETASPDNPAYPRSTYSGIWKYPNNSFVPSQSPVAWILGKRKDDGLGHNVWRVYDKLYNFENFIDIHPGGADWLIITNGTDITEAFESHHVINRELVHHTLSKYYIRDADEPRVSPFTFKEDGFYKVLRAKITPMLKEIGTQPTVLVKAIQDTLALTVLILALIGARQGSLLVQMLAGLILAMMITGAHNFLHIRENWRKYYFDCGLLSSYEFRISHALSHHLYPNTVMDFEMTMFQPLFMFFPTVPKNLFQRFGPILHHHVAYALAFFSTLFNRWTWILSGKQKLRPENFITIIELGLLMLIAPNYQSGVISWLVMHATCSYSFIITGINAGHHHPDAFSDGDEPRPDPDFGLCQLDALVERRSSIEKYLFTTLVTFGQHSMHHLFPAICHSKLEKIKPIFLETLKDYSETFHTSNQWDLYVGTFKELERTKAKQLSNGKTK